MRAEENKRLQNTSAPGSGMVPEAEGVESTKKQL